MGAVVGSLSAKAGTDEGLPLLELLECLCVELGGVHPKECYHQNCLTAKAMQVSTGFSN